MKHSEAWSWKRLRRWWQSFRKRNVFLKFTIMLVPHTSEYKPMYFNVPVGTLLLAFGSLFVLLGVTAFFGWSSYTLRLATVENVRLNKISTAQEAQLGSLQQSVGEIVLQLENLNETDAAVREQVGLPQREGTGGPGRPVEQGGAPQEESLLGDRAFGACLRGVELQLDYADDLVLWQKDALQSLQEETTAQLVYLAHLPTGVPVEQYNISSLFSIRQNPFGAGNLEYHDGVDFATDYGQPVFAAGAGVVVEAGSVPSYGNRVLLDHGYGYQTIYAHCSTLAVEPGDTVERGDIVGYVGSTGRSTGPHVHLGMTYNGVWMNPLELVDLSP